MFGDLKNVVSLLTSIFKFCVRLLFSIILLCNRSKAWQQNNLWQKNFIFNFLHILKQLTQVTVVQKEKLAHQGMKQLYNFIMILTTRKLMSGKLPRVIILTTIQLKILISEAKAQTFSLALLS
jgi:hypothetical protein